MKFSATQNKLIEKILDHDGRFVVRGRTAATARALVRKGIVTVHDSSRQVNGEEVVESVAMFTLAGEMSFLPEAFSEGESYENVERKVRVTIIEEECGGDRVIVKFGDEIIEVLDEAKIKYIDTWRRGAAERAYDLFV